MEIYLYMILQGSIEYFSRFFRLKLSVSDNRGSGSRFDFYVLRYKDAYEHLWHQDK